MNQGIVVGSDQSQEWLLPWWWENYQRHNRFPVAFVDFGLSGKMKQWCRGKGELIRLAPLFVKDREEVEPARVQEWESRYGENFWSSREGWFKKPHACLLSPFKKSIWIDLDCEVLGFLGPVFAIDGFALARDQIATSTYNSGVIVFRKNHPLIKEWADQSLEKNGLYRGDQDLLSQIILDGGFQISELPAIYNWNIGFGLNPEMVICHWLGEAGKTALRNQLILEQL